MNEKGFSFLEALLTLSISVVIFGTLLPAGTAMNGQLQEKRGKMHAKEAAFKAAILYQTYGFTSGVVPIEQNEYEWKIEADAVCIFYEIKHKAENICVSY